MSRAELADAVNAALDTLYPSRCMAAYYVDFRWVGKLERGEHRWPNAERRAALRAVFHVTADAQLGLYSPRRTGGTSNGLREAAWSGVVPDEMVELLGPWTSGMQVPSRIEKPHVEALRRSITLFEDMDHRYGGGLARAAMAGQLEWACRASHQASARHAVRRQWLSTAARLGDLVGWACFDAGEDTGTTRGYFVRSIQLAAEAEDVQQRTHTVTSLSRHLTYSGKAKEALQIVGLARNGWRDLPPLGRAVIGIVEARAYAALRDAEQCRRAVGLCDAHFDASPADGVHDPTWGYYADLGQILGDAGHAMCDLALTADSPTLTDATIARLHAAYELHPSPVARSRALTMIRIACLQAHQGNLAATVQSARAGCADAAGVHSSRLRDDVHVLTHILEDIAPEPGLKDELTAVRTRLSGVAAAQV
ncbi:hypothetical protein C1A38_24090 [Verrucosispora sp. ts21]|nr:hypothetical protein C1A38_24090 [Verrucosispora sp. ts21]